MKAAKAVMDLEHPHGAPGLFTASDLSVLEKYSGGGGSSHGTLESGFPD